MRPSTLTTVFSKKFMRIFNPGTAVIDLSALGFSTQDTARWEQLVERPNGIVLVTSRIELYKTTTLYSTLQRVGWRSRRELNASTAEDPTESIDPCLNQTQLQAQAQLDFGFVEGVRALMRQDSDVLMTEEIRDLEITEIVAQTALTGHLVFSILHTNDALCALTRLLGLGVPTYFAECHFSGRAGAAIGAHALLAIQPLLAIQLLAEAVKPKEIKNGSCRLFESYRLFKPVGYVRCRMTRFRRRMGIYELLVVGDNFRSLVHEGASLFALRK